MATDTEKPEIPADAVFMEREKFELKTNNHGTQEIELEYKQYKTYDAVLAAFGGESGALKVLNATFKNRSKAAGSAPIRLCPADADIAAAIAKGQEASRTYEYEERGVGVKKRLEKLEDIKARVKSGELDLKTLTADEIAEIMLNL